MTPTGTDRRSVTGKLRVLKQQFRPKHTPDTTYNFNTRSKAHR